MTTEPRMGLCPHQRVRALCPTCAPRWMRRYRDDFDRIEIEYERIEDQMAPRIEPGVQLSRGFDPLFDVDGEHAPSMQVRRYEQEHMEDWR